MTAEKLIQIAENEPKVYEAGKAEGIEQGIEQGIQEGYTKGYEAGRKAEYSRFWNGVFNINSWAQKFSGTSWNDDTFYPDRDIRPQTSSAYSLFAMCRVTDMVARLKECGVVLDTSGITGRTDNMFNYCPSITTVPYLDLHNAVWKNGPMSGMFQQCTALVSIEGIYVPNTSKLDSNESAFSGCRKLVEVRFDGVIAAPLSFGYCTKLSKASITSIINALSTTTSGLTVKLSKTAVDVAFYDEADGGRLGSETQEWETLARTKSNWTIYLN